MLNVYFAFDKKKFFDAYCFFTVECKNTARKMGKTEKTH